MNLIAKRTSPISSYDQLRISRVEKNELQKANWLRIPIHQVNK